VLHTPSRQIAFAHYPKTAGTSLAAWFQVEFPDAVPANPQDPHVPVAVGLQRFGYVRSRHRRRWRKLLGWPFQPRITATKSPLILGVLREPFAMLVSLFNYWRRRFPHEPYPEGSLGHTAATRDFPEFLNAAVVEKQLPNYRSFFDVGGPAWATTRLLDFRFLEPALSQVCREHDIRPPVGLPMANAAPHDHDVSAYQVRAGRLMKAVRAHFRWYYEEGNEVMIRGG
jgi:hypothetical protein